jgi:hypothetical protein
MTTTTIQRPRQQNNGPAVKPVPEAPDIVLQWEWITPEKAKAYLENNFGRNRSLKPRSFARLCEALRSGHFYPIHQAIAFDEDDKLVDGQHRLSAIVETGVATWLIVAYGVRREHLSAIDRGKARSDADQIRATTDMDIGHVHVAIAKAMWIGIDSSRLRAEMSDYDTQQFLIRHFDAIMFVAKGSRKKGLTAMVRGMIAKAYYHADQAKLVRFMEVLSTGDVMGPNESAATRLRDYSRELSRTGTHRMSIARRTISALSAFLEDRPLSKLYEASVDPFPLPK